VIAGVALRADAHHAYLPRAQPAQVLLGRFDVLEHRLCGRQYSFSGRGHQHPLPDPQEKPRPEPLLDAAQPMADGRLGPVQFAGGPRHAAGCGNGRDHLQIANIKFHDMDSSFR
jgi:hypothetical protein